jgi:hypothetical protein
MNRDTSCIFRSLSISDCGLFVFLIVLLLKHSWVELAIVMEFLPLAGCMARGKGRYHLLRMRVLFDDLAWYLPKKNMVLRDSSRLCS